MIKTVLINNSWSRFQYLELTIDFIGYIDFEDNLFITAEDLVLFFYKRNIRGLEFQDFLIDCFLLKSNGNFALIIKEKSNYIFACDHSRSYPLYIIKDNLKTIITDHIGGITYNKEHDQIAQEEFLLSGFVTGKRTIYKNVQAIQSGEIAVISKGDISFKRYFILHSDPHRLSLQVQTQNIYQEMESLFLHTFKRMIESCPNVNNWIVPLSGGYDSRLIINYLYKLGCQNVICFTYGIPSSKEAELSKLASEALGYKWYFVEYTPNDWKILHDNRLFDHYINYSFNGCCLPHTQDLLAIFRLKELAVISENDVIVPGHTAFTEAENRIVKDFSTDKQTLRYVYDKYYTFFKCKDEYPRFESNFKKLFEENGYNRNSFPEFFNWQERQAKYINNSLRTYEFLGLQWRLPFWGKNVIDFWQKLNFDDRIERTVLFAASKECLFDSNLKNIPIINKFIKPQPLNRIYLKIFPDRLISLIVRSLNRKPLIAEGTNLVFALKASSVKAIVGPMSIYPSYLTRYFNAILSRRPYQVNVNALTAIYTLRNEVFLNIR
jgi:asparagine synthase (glutamine-hydrolysing)